MEKIDIFPGMIENISDADKNKLAIEIEKSIIANRKSKRDLEDVFKKTNEKIMVVRHSVAKTHSDILYNTFACDTTTTDKLRIINLNIIYLLQTYNNYIMLKRSLTKQRPEKIAYHFIVALNSKRFQMVETMRVQLLLLSKKKDTLGEQAYVGVNGSKTTYKKCNDINNPNAYCGIMLDEERALIEHHCMDMVDLVGYLNKGILLNHDLYKNNPTISVPSTRYMRRRIIIAILHSISLYTYMYNEHYLKDYSLLEMFNYLNTYKKLTI